MSGIASGTAWALLHFLWQGALIGLITGGVLALLERRTASSRYAVAVGSLLFMAALPVVTALQLAPTPDAPATVTAPGSAGILPAPAPGSAGILPASSTSPSFGGSLLAWVLPLWLAGVAVLSLYHLGGWRLARRLARQGQPAAAAITSLGADLCRRLGIHRWVVFLESSAVVVPTVVGWLRPVVLIPASALAGLSPAQLEAILAHELAHVRRHDYLVNLLQTAIETLLFFHPAVWWVSAQIRRERENSCDDLAVAVCGNRLSYARALVDLEGLRTSPRLALAASGGSLSERVRRLMGHPGRSPRRFWAAGLLALVLLPAGAVVQLACSRDSKGAQNASATSATGASSTASQGRWKAEVDGNEIRLEATLRKTGWGTWTSINEYPLQAFSGLTRGSDVRFEMRREAGTFRFRGSFDGRRGRGTVSFAGNPEFARMTDLSLTSDRLMELAMQDISFDFIREMGELGYTGPAIRKASRADHSPDALLRRLFPGSHRYSLVDQLVQLRTHQITPEYIRGMQEAGYPRLQTWQLVELRIHNIEPEYVRGLRESGYQPRLPPFRIVEFKIHGISPEWLRGIVEGGFANATPEQIISMHIHGLDGDSIRRAASLGHRGLSPEDLVALLVQGKLG